MITSEIPTAAAGFRASRRFIREAASHPRLPKNTR